MSPLSIPVITCLNIHGAGRAGSEWVPEGNASSHMGSILHQENAYRKIEKRPSWKGSTRRSIGHCE